MYQIAPGYNNQAEFDAVVHQPRSRGVRPGRRQRAGDGLLKQDGFFSSAWEYGFLTKEMMEALMTQFGLSDTVPSAEVTISHPRNSDRDFIAWNAIIEAPPLPENGTYEEGSWNRVEFKLSWMEALE